MNTQTIHETIIRDIFDVAHDFAQSDEVERVKNFRNGTSIKSITSKAEALTMVFPVICSRNMTYDSACMISKAIERKAVALLQMLFSAANITDAEDGIDYISRFHTNLDSSRMSVDDFMRAMDTYVSENGLLQENTDDYDTYRKIQDDMKSMNFYFEFNTNINDIPLDAYQIVPVGEGGHMIVNTLEAEMLNELQLPDGTNVPLSTATKAEIEWVKADRLRKNAERASASAAAQARASARWANNAERQRDALARAANDAIKQAEIDGKNSEQNQIARDRLKFDKEDAQERNRLAREKNSIEADKAYWANYKAAEDIMKIKADIMRNRLVDNDVKKANELVPTLMYVNFISKSDDSSYPITTSMVVGVKAKLYAVDGDDIMNRLKIRHNSKNLLLNLVKVSTREISFFRDFLFAIDKAKIDALSQSRRGSSSSLWKVLERRANKSKARRLLNMKNDATAISTLCITQDEVEYMKKTEYFDVEDPRVIRPIMEAYNLMGFVIVDDAMEICKFMFDTDDRQYEVLTFTNLEREQRDNTKKILNLMAKMR